nr:zinc finger, CCHC-type [Tanacetum cinerariifolium]
MLQRWKLGAAIMHRLACTHLFSLAVLMLIGDVRSEMDPGPEHRRNHHSPQRLKIGDICINSKTHIVGWIWSGEYMDPGFIKSMKEIDSCYTMLEELRSVIVGGALIHKNYEGSKHEGQRIRPTIGDFGGTCASNQSPSNNERVEAWEEEKKEDRMTTFVVTNSVFRSFFKKKKLTGPNFIDWYRQLRIVLSVEDKLDYLEQPIPPAHIPAQAGQQVAPKVLAAHTTWVHQTNIEEESDIEAISETFFGDQADDLNEVVDSAQ